MGYELARSAKKRGYKTTLIIGPVKIDPLNGVRLLRVETGRELYETVRKELKKADILIMASAVSDFRPARFSKGKIKRNKELTLRLVRNPDILKSIAKKARKNKIIVGFSLETRGLLKNSFKKLRDKKLDLIVANKAGRDNAPFGEGMKTVYLLDKYGRIRKLENTTKKTIARAILDTVNELCYTPN